MDTTTAYSLLHKGKPVDPSDPQVRVCRDLLGCDDASLAATAEQAEAAIQRILWNDHSRSLQMQGEGRFSRSLPKRDKPAERIMGEDWLLDDTGRVVTVSGEAVFFDGQLLTDENPLWGLQTLNELLRRLWWMRLSDAWTIVTHHLWL